MTYQHQHNDAHIIEKNVLGGALIACCHSPKTGFTRDGFCASHSMDPASHTVCAQMTDDFLTFSKQQGNDLSTPRPEMHFTGLKAGDYWCLCASRWQQAYDAGQAPHVVLRATSEDCLEFVSLEALTELALDRPTH